MEAEGSDGRRRGRTVRPTDSGRTNNRGQLPQKHLLARSFLTIRTPSLSKKPSLWAEDWAESNCSTKLPESSKGFWNVSL